MLRYGAVCKHDALRRAYDPSGYFTPEQMRGIFLDRLTTMDQKVRRLQVKAR